MNAMVLCCMLFSVLLLSIVLKLSAAAHYNKDAHTTAMDGCSAGDRATHRVQAIVSGRAFCRNAMFGKQAHDVMRESKEMNRPQFL